MANKSFVWEFRYATLRGIPTTQSLGKGKWKTISSNEQTGYQPRIMKKEGYLSGSMLIITPGAFVPDGWLENYGLCKKYRQN